MLPFRFILTDLRRMWVGSLVIVVLVALATGFGVAINLQERALRLGSARAADRFDLVIGVAGSEAQLVLSSVFLQPSPLPLLKGEVLRQLSEDKRVAWAAPIGFGDSFEGAPIVGTTTQFVTDDGKRPLGEGRSFGSPDEAVIGARVELALGDTIKPLHGLAGEGGHTHTELAYHVVGRMAETGTLWDKAILVPIEGVWYVHGLGGHGDSHGHGEEAHADHDDEREHSHLGPPWGDDLPGVPAIVVKPRNFADAYKLRAEYRRETTLAVFPAEVLTRLYAALGDVRSVLAFIAFGAQGLIGAAVVLISLIHLEQRSHQIAGLRALGAPRLAIFGIVWLELMLLIGAGVLVGLGIGYATAKVVAHVMMQRSGIVMPVVLEPQEFTFIGILLTAAAVMALIPAWRAYRQTPAMALR